MRYRSYKRHPSHGCRLLLESGIKLAPKVMSLKSNQTGLVLDSFMAKNMA